ncbi:hypothetical protein QR680_015920 [Steinernema hermaphroditum]|uniref:Uncharacterized protein n=1 Tax=Steinernema hermaphroditum TaxID=289476 RepID=A0AA39H9F2_9BILA|nr:hypothetical protein QR680_015920 [Steinernema hermaphroditum]
MFVKAILVFLFVILTAQASLHLKGYSILDNMGKDYAETQPEDTGYTRVLASRPQRDRFMTLRLRQPYEMFRPSGYRVY